MTTRPAPPLPDNDARNGYKRMWATWSGRRARILLLLPAACAALTVGVLAYLSRGGPEDSGSFEVGLAAYNFLGPLLLAVLIFLGWRRWPAGMLVVLAASLIFTAFTVFALITLVIDDDANGVLLLLFLPLYQIVLVLVAAGATALLHWLRSRESRGSATSIHLSR